MKELALLLLLVFALAIGWTLGRRERKHSKSYELGLRHLLNEQQDEAVETLVEALKVDQDNIDTHLALGGLLRRRGELEKAVFVHENVLKHARLDQRTRHEVEIELARNYLQAGLLDRAEDMSVKLALENPQYRKDSLQVTLQVYEQERDWLRCIETAKDMTGGLHEARLESAISHYYCELAEEQIEGKAFDAARASVVEAIGHASNNPRTSLILGRLNLELGKTKEAILTLERILDQDPMCVGESLPLLRRAYDEAGESLGHYEAYLKSCIERGPSVSVVLELVGLIKTNEGALAVSRFMADHLRINPTVRGLIHLIDLHLSAAEGEASEYLQLLKDFAEALVQDKPSHRCRECGFEGKRMRWHCPSCRNWASIEPIFGLEGE